MGPARTLCRLITCGLLLAADSGDHARAGEPSHRFGIAVALDYLAEPIVNPIGGQENSGALLQGLWLRFKAGTGLQSDSERWREIDHWSLSTRVAVIRGDGNYYQQIGAAYPLQTMTSAGQWLTEAVIKRESGRSDVSFKAGVLTLNPDFMMSDVFNYYIHSAINDTFNEEVIGIPIAPLATTGIVVGYGHTEKKRSGLFKFGLFNVVSANQFGQSISSASPVPVLNGAVAIAQWQKGLDLMVSRREAKTLKMEPLNRELPAPQLLLGGYWSQTQASNPLGLASPIPQGHNTTLYGALTLPYATGFASNDNNRVWLAGRIGLDWQNNPAPYFAGVGTLNRGLIPGRPNDVTGLAAVTTGFSPTLSPGRSRESVIELNHLIHLSPMVRIKPFVQLIINPGGGGNLAPILAPGLQFSLSL